MKITEMQLEDDDYVEKYKTTWFVTPANQLPPATAK